jgi:hypothetical protein
LSLFSLTSSSMLAVMLSWFRLLSLSCDTIFRHRMETTCFDIAYKICTKFDTEYEYVLNISVNNGSSFFIQCVKLYC